MNQSPIRHIIPMQSSSAMDGVRLSDDSIKSLSMDSSKLSKLGIGVPSSQNLAVQCGSAMDSNFVNPVMPLSIGTPSQFLQAWLSGIIYIMTVVRKCDVLAPQVMIGNWYDQEIIQQSLERFGMVGVYKDHGDVPLTSWNLTYQYRDIVRFELGMQVQRLETDRTNALQVNTANEKRASIAMCFEMLRNDVFFHGYAETGMRVYGMLNDPNLPNFLEVQAEGANKEWAKKSVVGRVTDILTALRMLRVQSGGNIDPKNTQLILALPLSVIDLIHDVDGTNSFGFTVQKWLSENYPNIRIEAIPQFDSALGCPQNGVANNGWDITKVDNPNDGSTEVNGKNIFYLYAPTVAGTGTDGGETMVQLVPAKIQALNTIQTMKGWDEGFTSALAGCFVKRGYAVTRFFGI